MTRTHLDITIDLSRDEKLTEQAAKLLKDYYMRPEETSPQEAYARAARAFCGGDLELAQRIYDYASKGWFMFSSPILSNAPLPGEKPKALPISCFLSYVPDSLQGLIDHQAELAWLSVKGGGVGGHWSDVRSYSAKAPSPIPFLKVADSSMTAYKQGTTRKGSYAAYMDVSHPDIIEFLNIRVPTGGDENRKCFNLHNAVNLTDKFMEAVADDRDWDLVDPHSGEVKDTLKARELWQRILEVRFRTGEPYLNFIDEANRHLPQSQKDLGLKIHGSNLCNEIHLPTSEDRTAVCCLSSVNLEKWDEWKESTLVADLTVFLDRVLDAFIQYAPKELHKAVRSALSERSIGLGAMGFHSLLQSKRIPWESPMAIGLNRKIFQHIKEQAEGASMWMAVTYGEPHDMKGTMRRNAHLLAIAPNANSGIICGTSPSIEPIKSNAYTHRTRAGAHLVKNRHLEEVLNTYGKNDEATWQSIVLNEGSVQHLDFLSDWEKDVFKTAFEIDQMWVIQHAADRQEFICQGQSVNVFFPAGVTKSYVNQVHLAAWKKKLKGLYYLRTSAGVSADKVALKVERKALADADECVACQG